MILDPAEGIAHPSGAETRWIRELERVLLRAPARFALVTIGDAALTVIDADAASGADLHDGANASFRVASIRSGCAVHGVSG